MVLRFPLAAGIFRVDDSASRQTVIARRIIESFSKTTAVTYRTTRVFYVPVSFPLGFAAAIIRLAGGLIFRMPDAPSRARRIGDYPP
jgi:hypothetical protein